MTQSSIDNTLSNKENMLLCEDLEEIHDSLKQASSTNKSSSRADVAQLKTLLQDYHHKHEQQSETLTREKERNAKLERQLDELESKLEEKEEELTRVKKALQRQKKARIKYETQLKLKKHELYGLLECLDKSSRIMERSCEVLTESSQFGLASLEHLDQRANETEIRTKAHSVNGRVNSITRQLDCQLKENNAYLRATPCPSQDSGSEEDVSDYSSAESNNTTSFGAKTELPSSSNLIDSRNYELPFRDISSHELDTTTRFPKREKIQQETPDLFSNKLELNQLNNKIRDLEAEIARWKQNYQETMAQKGKLEEEMKKQKVCSGGVNDLEQLRKMQEQLFELVNILRQQIDEDDSQAPARLVFKRNLLAEEYPEALQVRLSREVHQRIREMKKSVIDAPVLSIYFSNQSDIRVGGGGGGLGQNSTLLLEDDSIMLPLQQRESTLKKQKVSVEVQTEREIGPEDLLSMLEVEAHTVEKLLRRA